MVTQEGIENRPPVDHRLLAADGSERVGYGLKIFRGLVRSERFGQALTRLDFNPLQAPFVTATAGLILQEDKKGFFQDNSVVFRPDSHEERKEEGRHARVYSPRKGVAELTAFFPTEERIIAGGLVYWKVIKIDEARALEPLYDGKRPFLRLVVMDPSLRNEDDPNPFVEATHSDEPDLRPKTLLNSIRAIVKGNPLYEVRIYIGGVGVVRYEKGKVSKEWWGTIPAAEGEGFLLVGKKANPRV